MTNSIKWIFLRPCIAIAVNCVVIYSAACSCLQLFVYSFSQCYDAAVIFRSLQFKAQLLLLIAFCHINFRAYIINGYRESPRSLRAVEFFSSVPKTKNLSLFRYWLYIPLSFSTLKHTATPFFLISQIFSFRPTIHILRSFSIALYFNNDICIRG